MFTPTPPRAQGRIDTKPFRVQIPVMGRRFTFLIFALVLAWAGAVSCEPADREVSGLNAFEHQLLANTSATATLARWCADHHLADPPRIRALLRRDVQKLAGVDVRRRLGADPDEAITYRRVDLVCGVYVLSRADNWYRPALLTPDMNRRLETTDTPFGQAVAGMGFHRQTLGLTRPGSRKGASEHASSVVLRVRALLISGAGAPFALVQEDYTPAILEDAR